MTNNISIDADFVINEQPDIQADLHINFIPDVSNFVTREELAEDLADKQDALTAGANITIDNNVISATDTTYTAGEGISIVDNVISNTQTSAEWGNIQGDITDQTDLIDLIDTKIDIEATARENNDLLLQNGINTLNNDLTAEISNRGTADGILQDNIDTLSDTVTNNYNALDSAITSEATTRANADTTLQSNIDTLSSTVTSNYNTLNGAITSEQTERENADNTLQDNIDTLSGTVTSNYNTLDGKIGDNKTAIDNHIADKTNPHEVTKSQVGLGNVDNTSDLNKPISTATQQALDGKVPTSRTVNGKALTSDITLTASDVNALPDTTKYAASMNLSIDGSTYVITAQLKDQNGYNIGTAQTIDLPLESVVVGGSYDSTNKKVILTLKDGSTIEFSVADLVSGLQTEITSSNKLDADLVDDSTSTNKFATASQLAQIGTNQTNISTINNTIGGYGDIVTHDTDEFATSSQGALADTAVQPADLSTVATTGDYDDLSNKPTIPTVNDATLTIQKNGTDVATFTANSSTNQTANITVPTQASDIGALPDTTTIDDLTTAEQQSALNSGATSTNIGQIATNTQNISNEATNRQNADNNLQSQIDALVVASDVFDIVGTYAELQAYDISTVPVNDIIKVLVDSTHNNAATYYRCVENDNVKSWLYIGAEGAYYTKSEADNRFVEQTTTINGQTLSNNITLDAEDVGALPDSTTIGNGTLTIQKNGSTIDSFGANDTGNTTVNITVPTDTGDLTNNAGYITGINSTDVINALGYTPYDSSNPDGYTDNVGTVTSVNNTQPDANGNVTLSIPAAQVNSDWNASSGVAQILNKPTIPTVNDATLTIQKNGSTVKTFTANASTDVTCNITVPTKTSDITNDSGYITGINSSDVTTALGYTPYDSSNPSGYTTNVGTVTKVNNTSPDSSGNVTLSIPAAQIQSDWTQTTTTAKDYIKNKPNLATVATSGSYNDLTNKPTIPAAQVQSNWNETDTSSKAYIQNKPSLSTVATTGDYDDLLNKPTIPAVGDGTITINQGGVQKGTFTTNQSGNSTIDLDAGSSTDVQINGTSIVSSDVANIVTNGTYNATSNKIATMSDIPSPVTVDSALSTTSENPVQNKVINSALGDKLDKSGGTMTGNLSVGSSSIGTNGYIQGTWIQTTAATSLDSATDIAVLSNGWIYKQSKSTLLNGCQTTTNLVTSVSSSSTDSQYPSAKCVYDIVGDIETALNTINSGSST